MERTYCICELEVSYILCLHVRADFPTQNGFLITELKCHETPLLRFWFRPIPSKRSLSCHLNVLFIECSYVTRTQPILFHPLIVVKLVDRVEDARASSWKLSHRKSKDEAKCPVADMNDLWTTAMWSSCVFLQTKASWRVFLLYLNLRQTLDYPFKVLLKRWVTAVWPQMQVNGPNDNEGPPYCTPALQKKDWSCPCVRPLPLSLKSLYTRSTDYVPITFTQAKHFCWLCHTSCHTSIP